MEADPMDSEIERPVYEDIFRMAFTRFMKNCTNPCHCPSRIVRTGESRWRRLSKQKKKTYIINAINARKKRMRNKCKRKKRKSPPKCELAKESPVQSQRALTTAMDDLTMFDACCPKKRKRRCPKKPKRRCPKKRKPSCRKKKPAYCRILKVRGG